MEIAYFANFVCVYDKFFKVNEDVVVVGGGLRQSVLKGEDLVWFFKGSGALVADLYELKILVHLVLYDG